MKLSNCGFNPKTTAQVDEGPRREKAAVSTLPLSVPGDVPVIQHKSKRHSSPLELGIRTSLKMASAPQNGRPLFDTTQEPKDVRASIEWLEKKHYSLGDEKNSPPSKLITAEPPTELEKMAPAPQNGRPLFDTTQEPAYVRASIEWLEKEHYSLGDEKNSPPSKLITAEPPTEKEANGGFKARELGARLSDDKIIALHTTPDGILLGHNDDLFRAYLDNSKLCPLAPDQIGAICKITSPNFPTHNPCLEPRLVNIDARTATHLTCARTAIDLVKTLLPFGAGNQVKDLVRTGGESYLRSALAGRMGANQGDAISNRATTAISWKSGDCQHHAALTFAILRSLPELKDAQIDCVLYPDPCHFMVVIRGDTPEHDVIVDPWVPFAVPGLPADATDLHREMAQRPDPEKNPKILIAASKPAGKLVAPLEIAKILRDWKKYGGEDRDPYKQYSEEFLGTPADYIHLYLTNTKNPEMWDTLYSCNPNARYRLEGKDGEPPMMLRFDMQRVAKNPEDQSPEALSSSPAEIELAPASPL